MTIEIGHSRIVLGRAVAIYVEDRFVDPAGPYIKADELHPIGRMSGLGNFARTPKAHCPAPETTLTKTQFKTSLTWAARRSRAKLQMSQGYPSVVPSFAAPARYLAEASQTSLASIRECLHQSRPWQGWCNRRTDLRWEG